MKIIKLTRGRETFVDDDTYKELSKFQWCCKDNGYAARRGKDNKHHYLHREVVGAKKGDVVDHINGDRLDNRKENLRICTWEQNSWNTNKRKVGAVPFVGVYKNGTGVKKYAARIKVNKKTVWLGRFENAVQAHQAYKEACVKYRGVFARFE